MKTTLGVEVVAVPSFLSPDNGMLRTWEGYSGAPNPGDVAPGAPGRITERQAWLKYSLAGRIGDAGADFGLNVFLRGQLWNRGDAGFSIRVRDGATIIQEAIDGAAIVCLWR